MATRPVQDAVDRNSGAKVYLTGHAQVTFMSDGRSVEEAINAINSDGEENVQSDWNETDTSSDAYIKNKPSLASVAISGSYDDLSNKPSIPSAVTESTVSGWGFTKNTGTYIKPSNGIPKTDLSSDVQTSLGKADTALQEIPSNYVTISSFNTLSRQNITSRLGTINGQTIWADPSGADDPPEFTFKTINGESILGDGDISLDASAENDVYVFHQDVDLGHGTIALTEFEKMKTCNSLQYTTGDPEYEILHVWHFTQKIPIGENEINWRVTKDDQTFELYFIWDGEADSATWSLNNSSIYTFKTINGQSITGSGDITIASGGYPDANVSAVPTSETLDDVETNTYVKYVAQTLTDPQKLQVRTNIGVDLDGYYTKSEIDSQIGDINSVLESIING